MKSIDIDYKTKVTQSVYRIYEIKNGRVYLKAVNGTDFYDCPFEFLSTWFDI